MFRATYWTLSGLALALLLLDGAAGTVLATTPDRGKVERDKTGSVRGGGGVYVWLGGGYQGGK